MKNIFILLAIGAVAFLFFSSRSVPPIGTSLAIPLTETPSNVLQTPTPVTITELLEPIYASIFSQDKDTDPIADSATNLADVSNLLQTQPNSLDAATTQILASSRLLCVLMKQAVNETIQARNRLQTNQSGRTANTQFFDSMIEQKWRASLSQIRNQASSTWTRLQQLESSHPAPILATPAQSVARSLLTARRKSQSNQRSEEARAAASEAAERHSPVSSMQRIGGG